MIKYMTVERIDRAHSKNGSPNLSLPFSLESLDNLSNLDSLPTYKKLMLIAEQYILAKSIDDMMYQDNEDLSDFIYRLKVEARRTLESKQKDIDQSIYAEYRSAVTALLKDFTVSNSLINMFNDYNLYPKEDRLLPKEYWRPFLEIAASYYTKNQYTYSNAIMLYPELKNDVVVFHSKSGTCMYKKYIPEHSLNKQLNYLLHFNWDQSNWLTLLGVIGSYCIDPVSKLKSNKSVPHFLRAVEERTTTPMVNYSEVRYQLLSILRDGVSSIDKTPYVESISYLLDKLNVDKNIISALSTKNPTYRDIMYLDRANDLGFLKNMVVSKATEAAGDDASSGDDDSDEDDPLADGGDDDDFDDTSLDDDSGDDSSDGDSLDDDTGGDLGDTSDDDFGGDDSFGDDSSSDSSDSDNGKTTQKENKVQVPDDPYTLLLKVANSETFDDYLLRNEAIAAINAILISPPSTLSGDDLKFLRIWVTQWINFFPIETTKAMLSKLSVYFTDIE